MNPKILLLAVAVASFSSCTTSYKSGQTPDDVYYSPIQPRDEYVQTRRDDNRDVIQTDEYYEDQYLRMKVRNRARWADIDDPYYYNRRNNYTTYFSSWYGNPWTPYSYWNNYYNPYYNNYIIVNPKTIVRNSGPRTFNLSAYNSNPLTNNTYSTSKYVNGSGNNGSRSTYTAPRNQSNTRNNNGNDLRDVFRSSNNNSSSSNTNSSSSSSSSSGSSSSSSSSGSSAPVRKF